VDAGSVIERTDQDRASDVVPVVAPGEGRSDQLVEAEMEYSIEHGEDGCHTQIAGPPDFPSIEIVGAPEIQLESHSEPEGSR
jgi:hypothetical protein